MGQSIDHANLDAAFGQLTEFWSPRVVAAANGQYVKVAKVKGEFVWHAHADEDEFFLVRRGELVIRYRDRADVVLREGDKETAAPAVSSRDAAVSRLAAAAAFGLAAAAVTWLVSLGSTAGG